MIGIIYKLKCLETDEFYIGSTFNMNERIYNHKKLKQNKMKSKQIIKRNNYKFIILEEREINNTISLKLIENLYILIGWKISKCINNNLAFRTKQIRKFMKDNYYQKNKDYFNKKSLKLYYKNKEKVKCNYCNSYILKCSLKRHQKTKKCLNNRLNL